MKKIEWKLKVARKRIAEVEWHTLFLPLLKPPLRIQIERALLVTISRIQFGVDGVAIDSIDTVRDNYGLVLRLGEPDENPAQCEIYLPFGDRLPVYYSTVDGKVYATAEPMFAFDEE